MSDDSRDTISEPVDPADVERKRRKRADDKFDRYAWRDAVFADPKVPANVKVLAFGIAKHVNGETGEARVGTLKLAKLCGHSEKWVRNTIPLLHNTGWMVVVEFGSKGRGEDHTNRYSINPEKRTPCTLLKTPEKQVPKADFSHRKADFSHRKAYPGYEEPLTPNPKEERGTLSLSSDDDRESIATNSAKTKTADDAPNSEPVVRPVPRAEARTELITQQPFRDDPPHRNNPATQIGAAANDAAGEARIERARRERFERVKSLYPADHIGDEDEAFQMFCATVDGWLTREVSAAFAELLRERGDDVPPPLAEALMIIARKQAAQEHLQ